MPIALLALAVCVIGLLAWFASGNAKVAEAGRLAFFAGLFVFLLQVPGVVTIGD